jgi:lipopolysaccharide export LptBFGC system permease protein LptF
VVCVAALGGAIPRSSALVLLVAVFAGLIGGRVVSLVLNRGMSGYPAMIVALYGIDSVGLVLSAMALKWDRT